MRLQRDLVHDSPFFWSTNAAYHPHFHPPKLFGTINREHAIDVLRDTIVLESVYDLSLVLVPVPIIQ
jgi:hypothetical protein